LTVEISEGEKTTESVLEFPVLLNAASVVGCQVYKIEISSGIIWRRLNGFAHIRCLWREKFSKQKL